MRASDRMWLIASLAIVMPAVAHAEVAWRPTFAAAQAEAKKSHTLLFVEFTVPG